MNKNRLLMVIPSLRGGGAERVFAILAGGLSSIGLDVHLALAQREGAWLSRLSKSVSVHDLEAPRVRQAAWPIWKLVRRIRPQCVLSTISHINVVVGLVRVAFPGNTRVVMRESTSMLLSDDLPRSRPSAVQKAAYRAADRIICLSDEMRDGIHQRFGIPLDRLTRIYNPIDSTGPETDSRAGSPSPFPSTPGPHLLSIGRLDPSKGFDRLIAAFPECLRKHPAATLTIIGDGPDRRPLEAQVRSLGLDQRVAMPGFDPQIHRWLQHADLFVLASRFEGLPNVLLEAIDASCPVAVLEHPGGSREVLRRIGQEHRWTDRLEQWRPEWFERPGADVHRKAIAQFGFESIVRQYAEVVRDVAESKRAAA